MPAIAFISSVAIGWRVIAPQRPWIGSTLRPIFLKDTVRATTLFSLHAGGKLGWWLLAMYSIPSTSHVLCCCDCTAGHPCNLLSNAVTLRSITAKALPFTLPFKIPLTFVEGLTFIFYPCYFLYPEKDNYLVNCYEGTQNSIYTPTLYGIDRQCKYISTIKKCLIVHW